MKTIARIVFTLTAFALLTGFADAQQEQLKPSWLTIDNRLRLEYDDNYSTSADNEQSSFKIIEQIQVMGELNLDETYVSIRLQPSFLYWDDRDEDSDDFHNELDMLLSHNFTPRTTFEFTDTLRASELPELRDDRGVSLRQDNEYFYNSASASLAHWATRQWQLKGSGRYVLLDHADDDVATREDYDLYAAGLSLQNQFGKNTAINGKLRYQTVTYPGDPDAVNDVNDDEFIAEGSNRDSDTISASVGISHEFSPNLLGSASAGWSQKDYDRANKGSSQSPTMQGTVTFLPSPATRLSVGASYGLYEADVYPFVNQTRSSLFASIAHDMNEKLSWFLSSTYINGEYDSEETADTVDEDSIRDGSDQSILFSARVQYQVLRNNALEIGWQFSKLDTDLRENFTRNRYNVGWKLRL